MPITPEQARAELRRREALTELQRREPQVTPDLLAAARQALAPEPKAPAPLREEARHALARGGIKAAATASGALASLMEAGAQVPGGWYIKTPEVQAGNEAAVRRLRRKAADIYKTADAPSLAPTWTGPAGFIVNTAGETAPVLVASVASSIFGPVGPLAVGTATGGEMVYQEARKAGATHEQAETERWIAGPVMGLLERLQADEVLKVGKSAMPVLVNAARKKLYGQMVKQGGKITARQAIGAAAEGLEEGLQQVTQIGAATIHGEESLTRQNLEKVLTAIAGGTAVGGPMKTALGVKRGLGELGTAIRKEAALDTIEKVAAMEEPEAFVSPFAGPEDVSSATAKTRVRMEGAVGQEVEVQKPPVGAPQEPSLVTGEPQPAVATGERPPISTRNVDTAAVRAEADLPPLQRTGRVPLAERQAQWAAEAPSAGEVDALTAEILANPRAMTPAEEQGFRKRIVEVRDARDALIAKAKDLPANSQELKTNIEARKTYQDHIDNLSQVTKLGGREWSFTGLSRQNPAARLLEDEMSPSAMEAKAEEIKGDRLTPAETAEVHAKSAEVKETVERAEKVRKIETTRKANQAIRQSRSRYSKMTEAEKDAELAELMERAKNPSEDDNLDKLFYNMAMNLGSRPGIRGVSDVAARLQSDFDQINRYSLSDAIVNATTKKARDVDEMRLLLQTLRREARTDKRLRTAIDEILWHLEEGTVPEPNRNLRNENEHIRALRDTLAHYKEQLKDSEPAQIAKYERLISTLENRIASGDFTIKERGPVSEVVADLQAKYKRLQAEFNKRAKVSDNAAKMQKLEREIAALEKRAEEGAYQKMPRTEQVRELDELDELRSRKAALQTELSRQAAAQREIDTLRATVKSLQDHLNAGTAPQKAPKIGEREPVPMVVALREVVEQLRKRIAESKGGQKARLEKQLARLQERLRTGDYQLPPKGEKPLRSEELEKLDYQIYRARQELNKRIAQLDPIWNHPLRAITQPFRDVQEWKSSLDMSALARQGGIALRSHPIRTLRRLPEAIRAAFDPEKAWKIQNEMFNGERSWWYNRVGLEFTDYAGGLNAREEAFSGNLIERAPGIGKLVRGSNRGFVTLLNMIRRDSFDAMERGWRRPGGLSLDESKAIANYVNVMTGRGSMAGLEKYTPVLNGLLWSPRFTVSRIQYRLGMPIGQAPTWRTRRIIAQEYARYLAGVAAMTWLYEHVFGGKVERDRRSSNFGKIVIGNTRLDPLSGLSQVTVLGERVLRSETKTQKGEIVPLSPNAPDFPYRGDTRGSVALRFARGKLGYFPGLVVDIWTGKDFTGEPITLADELGKAVVPLGFEDVLKLIKDQGVPKGAALEMLNLFGEGVQTYTPKKRGPVRREPVRRRLRK